MVLSMTGYASAIVEIPVKGDQKLSLAMHIKSLNSRYFEATCKLPYLVSHLEVAMHRLLKKQLHRGHVFLTIKVQHDATVPTVIPSLQTVKSYLKAIDTIKKECKIDQQVSLESLLAMPNILQVEEESLSSSTEKKVLSALENLAQELIKTRTTEGKELAHDLKQHAHSVTDKLKQIKVEAKNLLTSKKEELTQIIKQLHDLPEDQVSEKLCLLETRKSTLLSELEKVDINEEIVRAQSHIKNLTQMITNNDELKGKKLDFILQELNREMNTIASKCSNMNISTLAIDVKAELEKSREQSQNIL